MVRMIVTGSRETDRSVIVQSRGPSDSQCSLFLLHSRRLNTTSLRGPSRPFAAQQQHIPSGEGGGARRRNQSLEWARNGTHTRAAISFGDSPKRLPTETTCSGPMQDLKFILSCLPPSPFVDLHRFLALARRLVAQGRRRRMNENTLMPLWSQCLEWTEDEPASCWVVPFGIERTIFVFAISCTKRIRRREASLAARLGSAGLDAAKLGRDMQSLVLGVRYDMVHGIQVEGSVVPN